MMLANMTDFGESLDGPILWDFQSIPFKVFLRP